MCFRAFLLRGQREEVLNSFDHIHSLLSNRYPPPTNSGDNVEEAFLETARKIYEKIQNGRWGMFCLFSQFMSLQSFSSLAWT